MARIGYPTLGGFTVDNAAERDVLSCKFTAPSNMTAIRIVAGINDNFGSAGTAYFAIYADDGAGSPTGAPLASASKAYSSLQSGWLESGAISVALTSGVAYHLAWYAEATGTFNVDGEADSDASFEIRKWNEPTPGSWTTTPTSSQHTASRKLSIFADSAAATTTTTSSTTSSSTSSSTSTSTSTSTSSSSSSSSSTSTTTEPPAAPVRAFSIPDYNFVPNLGVYPY